MEDYIILIGASGAGKTTLAREIATVYDGKLLEINEVARELLRKKKISHDELKLWTQEDPPKRFLQFQRDILREQAKQEIAMVQRNVTLPAHSRKGFISDRSVVDAIVFAWLVGGEVGGRTLMDDPNAVQAMSFYRNQLVFVVEPLHQVQEDGVRLTHIDSWRFTDKAKEILHDANIAFVTLPNLQLSERVELLLQSIMTPTKTRLPSSLPRPLHVSAAAFRKGPVHGLRCMSISRDGVEFDWEPVDPQRKTSRFEEKHSLTSLLKLQFTRDMSDSVVQSIVERGITIDGDELKFIGCTNSGLKSRSCLMFKGNPDEELRKMGEFGPIKSVSKKIARVGLLFSKCLWTERIDEKCVRTLDDVSRNKYVFTDGCGQIGSALAQKVATSLGLTYIPSVLQIRFQGCKGVVALNRSLAVNVLLVRPSMIKFETKAFPRIGIINWSKPESGASLNRQFILLLSSRGVPDKVFLDLFHDHFQNMRTMLEPGGTEAAIQVLQWLATTDPSVNGLLELLQTRSLSTGTGNEKLSKSEFKHSQPTDQKAFLQKLQRVRAKALSDPQKLRCPVAHSRNVFGVADPTNALPEGCVFFRPTIRGKPTTIRGTVLVAKCPSYLEGDIRVLNAVASEDHAGLKSLESSLVDCIVFPTQGRRPHPSEIAGSDLDGDQYFVCWDQALIPPKHAEPYAYPDSASKREVSPTWKNTIKYFAEYKNQSGLVDSLFRKWADLNGPGSTECQRLGQLFAKAIDAAKSGASISIPPELRTIPDGKCPEHVWTRLAQLGEEEKQLAQKQLVAGASGTEFDFQDISTEYVLELLDDENVEIGEFTLFKFAIAWLKAKHPIASEEQSRLLLEIADRINFGKFSADQQLFAIQRNIPASLVMSALNKSRILSASQRSFSRLNYPGWRLWLQSSRVEFEWVYLTKALRQFSHTLTVFHLRDGVSFAFQFLKKFEGDQVLSDQSIVGFFFSARFGYQRRVVLDSSFSMCVDPNGVLQIFQGEKRSTFVWMGIDFNNVGKHRISVDLNRFDRSVLRNSRPHPLVTKHEIFGVEIYIDEDKDRHRNYFDSLNVGYSDVAGIDCPVESPDILDKTDLEYEQNCAETCLTRVEALLFPSRGPIALVAPTPNNVYDQTFPALCKGESRRATPSTTVPSMAILEDKTETRVQVSDILLLLRGLQQCTYGRLEGQIQARLQTILTRLDVNAIASPHVLLQLVAALTLLNLHEFIRTLLDQALPKALSLEDLVQLCMDWQSWMVLETSDAQVLLTKYCPLVGLENNPLASSTLSELCSGTPEAASMPKCLPGLVFYLTRFARLQLLGLLNESQSVLEKWKEGPASGLQAKMEKRDASQLVLVGVASDKYPVLLLSFFRSQALSLDDLEVGRHVILSRSCNLLTRLSFGSTACFAQVESVSSAPVSLVLKITCEDEGEAAHFRSYVERKRAWKWRVDVVGNVPVFIRAMHALGLVASQSPKLPLLPILIHPGGFVNLPHDPDVLPDPAEVPDGVDIKAERSMRSHVSVAPTAIPHDPEVLTDVPAGVDAKAEDLLRSLSPYLTELSDNLNDEQRRAILASLSQRVTLIHGPPGTGKTNVACECIRRAINLNKRVLAVAETNYAADNLAKRLRLAQVLQIVRLGNPNAVDAELYDLTLHGQCELRAAETRKPVRRVGMMTYLDQKACKEIIRAASVVVSTCASAGDPLLENIKFDFLLVDEATQVCFVLIYFPQVFERI
jgi:predicted ATPase